MRMVCSLCGWVYDEAEGYEDGGIAPGTSWADVPEDFALDYLLAFIRRGERGNSCLGGPQTMISGCADAILLMHKNGRAKERIERELKAIQSYSISYRYSDSDNDIRDERDEFRVRYWK